MPTTELSSSSSSSGYSPDSVIYTLQESNFSSLFSSSSTTSHRFSFTSDAHQQQREDEHLALAEEGEEEEHESWSGPDLLDPNNISFKHNNNNNNNKTIIIKVAQAASKEDTTHSRKHDNLSLPTASPRNSFSLALKECQERRSRSEALSNKLDRKTTSNSLYLNNVASSSSSSSSPRLVKKGCSVSTRKSGTFHSPGTPNYRHASIGMQKGWSSERVPLHANGMRRQQLGGAAFLPFTQGRTIPSKWEDAERWIVSPVSGDGVAAKPSFAAPQRRPKSKSGPLGPPGIAYYSLYSPAMPMFDGEVVQNFMAGSPFSAGVIAADGMKIRSGGSGGTFDTRTEPCMGRSASVHGCSETLNTPSLTARVQYTTQEHLDGVKDAATDVSRTVSRRDMATQMSPDGSARFSPNRGPSFSATTPSILPIIELPGVHSSKPEVRDVQVDERVTVTRWSKKNRSKIPGKSTDIVEDWRKKDVSGRSSWEIESAKSISNSKREEAKIAAWENLQKAKAESAIRKLEMKLEKKRSSSMDRIMNKLRSAQRKAQEMRSSAQTNQMAKNSEKALSLRRTRQMGSLSGGHNSIMIMMRELKIGKHEDEYCTAEVTNLTCFVVIE
ncbi:hypothetical protein ACFE04_004733 [Oxalis oulophora]